MSDNPSEPKPIDLTRARDHEPEVRTWGDVTSPGSRLALAILWAIGGGLVMVLGAFVAGGADGEPSATSAFLGGVLVFAGAIVIVSSQYHLIAAGVARGILDARE